MFLDQQRVQKKLYRGGYDQKKKSQNENSQRWIDSQLNSAPFKTDFKLKWQFFFSNFLVKIHNFPQKRRARRNTNSASSSSIRNGEIDALWRRSSGRSAGTLRQSLLEAARGSRSNTTKNKEFGRMMLETLLKMRFFI